ncbi:MAG: DUF1318 domain-containing protein [Planctomycetes bacterium]|nr:DUF1318 domain-containing protein [Planctomycetota bacterium]
MNLAHHARAGLVLALLPLACTSHRISVDPIEVKPIYVTVDVNVKVQRELDEFFEFEDEIAPEAKPDELPGEEAASSPEKTRGGLGFLSGARSSIALPLLLIALNPATSAAQDPPNRDALQERMKGRYAALHSLRDTGKVGETYDGLGAAVKPEFEKEKVDPKVADSPTIGDLLRAENADRRALYALLATELKISVEEVGKQNGLRNLKKAAPTHWFRPQTNVWAQRKDIKASGR